MIRMCDSDSESHEGKSSNNCVIYPIKQAGMKADGFERRGQSWYVATDFPNDLVVEIEDVSLHIHKFPLLSRCGRLNRMLHEFRSDTEKDHIRLDDIPGGAEAFELAAKFCYGVAVDLNSSNISGLRCAAEYLEMSEDLEEGNLIFKTEAFLSYVVLSSWRDSIIVLKSCEELSPWAENLQIVRRCSESIAWKACANTLKQGVRWSYTVSKSAAKKPNQSPHWNETKTYSPGHQLQVPPDWWFEDVSILRIDHFVKVITAIKVKGMRFELIGASIMHYASKCLPGISGDSSGSEDNNNNNNDSWKGGGLHIVLAEGRDDLSASNAQLRSEQRLVVESLISILPPQKDTVSCSFLLRLLRMANMLKVAPALVTELEKRVGMQLEQATLNDLLIPSYTAKSGETLYDVDLVQRLLDHFLIQQQTQQPTSPSHCASSAEKHYAAAANAKTKVARLVDSYITEIARDRNLSMTKFQVLAEALPDSARTCDDGLYRAIDSYLKAHPTLSEHERKRLCKVMNCQKLSIDACIHAAHNERLPLRIVVQVLFSEQAKIANAIASNGLPVDKEQTDNHHHHRMDFQSQGTDRFSRVLENLPQSFQEGWSSTKKDIKTIIFDMENLKSKVLQLQSEIDTLNHQFIKFSKPTSSGGGSAWSTGWKKLSKLKHSFVFHTHTQDMGSLRADAPQQVASKTRRWRNSIS